jgi:hypothetical protein
LSYSAALDAVARDRAVLSQLRTRTSVLLTAISVVTALFGAAAFKQTAVDGVAIGGALGWFAFGLACCLGVLWPVGDRGAASYSQPANTQGPRRGWAPYDAQNRARRLARGFAWDCKVFLARWIEWARDPGCRRWKVTLSSYDIMDNTFGVEEPVAKMRLADLLFDWHEYNMRTIERKTDLLQLAGIALLLQTGFWAWAALS